LVWPPSFVNRTRRPTRLRDKTQLAARCHMCGCLEPCRPVASVIYISLITTLGRVRVGRLSSTTDTPVQLEVWSAPWRPGQAKCKTRTAEADRTEGPGSFNDQPWVEAQPWPGPAAVPSPAGAGARPGRRGDCAAMPPADRARLPHVAPGPRPRTAGLYCRGSLPGEMLPEGARLDCP
jgi:hypothetical protein